MAAASEQNDAVSVWNSAEIVFLDKDDFPLANLMEHVQSDDNLDDDLSWSRMKKKQAHRSGHFQCLVVGEPKTQSGAET